MTIIECTYNSKQKLKYGVIVIPMIYTVIVGGSDQPASKYHRYSWVKENIPTNHWHFDTSNTYWFKKETERTHFILRWG